MTDRELDRRAAHRLAVIRHAQEVSGNVAKTCRYYGISRQVYYKWLRRYEAGGLAEIIVHGRTGLLADARDDDAFCGNLVRVLKNHELRERLSVGAREDAARFGVERHADALTHIYEHLLEARRGKAA